MRAQGSRRRLRAAVLAGISALGADALGQEPTAQPAPTGHRLVVVLNLRRPETDIPLRTLTRIYRGEQLFWPNGDPIHAVTPPEDNPSLRESFLASVARLDGRAFVLHWKSLIFRGDATEAPVSPTDERSALRTVFAARGSVAVVEGSTVRNLATVAKVVTVDGHAKDDPTYPLKW
jgi:hypothetical protein